VAKAAYARGSLGLPWVSSWLLATIGLIAILQLPVLYLRRGSFVYALLLDIVVSAILLSDLIYFRNFNSLLPVKAVGLARQLGPVMSDVIGSLRPCDLLLCLDLPLILLYRWWMRRRGQVFCIERLPVIALVLLLVLGCTSVATAAATGVTAATLGQFGALQYHVSDLIALFSGAHGSEQAKQVWLQKNANYENAPKNAFGLAKGKNLILVQVESLQNLLINRTLNGKEITPVLNRLIGEDSFYFPHFFQTVGMGRTSDAEWSVLNSLYPAEGEASYQAYTDRQVYSLPLIMRQQGYQALAFHGFKPDFWNRERMYLTLGFEHFYSKPDFTPDGQYGWGVSDIAYFRQSVDVLAKGPSPFFAFLVTLSGHSPYYLGNDPLAQELDVSRWTVSDSRDTRIFGNYFQAAHYSDAALGSLLADLQRQGLDDNSVIVIYGDHYGIPWQNEEQRELMSEYLGEPYRIDQMMNIPLLIHIPGLGESRTISITGGETDILPTLLNLFGIAKDEHVALMGQDLLNATAGFVAEHTFLAKGSFIDNQRLFRMSSDGVFEHSEAWDIQTGEPVPLTDCRAGYQRALNEINYSHFVMDNDRVFSVQAR
jgi:phosphoglycerol transferase MdoB-like AlkP superfamily enzyme